MKFNNYTFHERSREVYPDGHIILRGIMDMGDYDERSIVSISRGVAVAYVESEVIEVAL